MAPTYSDPNDTKQYEIGRNEFDLEIIRLAKPYLSDANTLLEVGCGNGRFLKNLMRSGYEGILYGIDSSDAGIDICKKTIPGTFVAADFLKHQHTDRFEIVCCFQTLEHIEEADNFVINLRNHIADGGTCIISAPNRHLDKCSDHIHFWNQQEFTTYLNRFFSRVNVIEFDKNMNLLAICKTR